MSDERRLISPVAATLLRAADYIEAHGWCQGEIEDSAGAVCVYGAIHSVTRSAVVSAAAANTFAGHIRYGVSSWNDKPGRTKAEVVEALRGAAIGTTSGKSDG